MVHLNMFYDKFLVEKANSLKNCDNNFLFSPQPTNFTKGYCYPPFRPSVCEHLICSSLSAALGMKPLFEGIKTSHGERIYIADVQR